MNITRALGAILLLSAASCVRSEPETRSDLPGMRPAGELPLKLAPRATTSEITAADLMTRLYIFADDSMMGRQAGHIGNNKGTDYIARELQRLGVEPAGEQGTYFQALPYVLRSFAAASVLNVGGAALTIGTDFVASTRVRPRALDGVQVIHGGVYGDLEGSITPEAARGKIVLLGMGANGNPAGNVQSQRAHTARYADAAAVAIVNMESLTPAQVEPLTRPGRVLDSPAREAAVTLHVTRLAAERLLGSALASAVPGQAGQTVRGSLLLRDEPQPVLARNVIGVIRGSDPTLRNEYVALGAHNDHTGMRPTPLDHDSVRTVALERARLQRTGMSPVDVGAAMRNFVVNVDSLRRIRPARMDSVFNGADDDGSGSVALLEIAEAMMALPQADRPRRSMLFVWHSAEESGLLGARHFTDNPTVPLTAIVAQLNMDMVGRGTADDVEGGGPDYLLMVGHRRLSTQLGDMVEAVNRRQVRPFRFDFSWDAPDHPQQIYGRSDHAMYARYGIPVAFIFTGLHVDYHQITDEPQYIDYMKLERVARYVRDLAMEVGNAPQRPRVDRRD